MTKDDIIRMAREAGFPFNKYGLLQGDDDNEIDADAMLERFAALVADAEAKRIYDEGMVTVGHMREQIAAEREACAKVADRYVGADPIADAIRARGRQ